MRSQDKKKAVRPHPIPMKKLIITLFVLLAFQQSAWAGFTEGASAYNNKNYALAYKEILPLAKTGNADAQHLLGLMYYMGRGLP